jgi:hypothetical protein
MQDDFDLGGFFLSQGEMIPFDEILYGVAQWCMTFYQDRLAFEDPHLNEAPAQWAGPADAGDHRSLAGSK